MLERIRVVIESPYAASKNYSKSQHEEYLNLCILDALVRGETPYASHAINTRVWDDTNPEQRKAGIGAGYPWQDVADVIAFYVDLGDSPGMQLAHDRCHEKRLRWATRNLPEECLYPIEALGVFEKAIEKLSARRKALLDKLLTMSITSNEHDEFATVNRRLIEQQPPTIDYNGIKKTLEKHHGKT